MPGRKRRSKVKKTSPTVLAEQEVVSTKQIPTNSDSATAGTSNITAATTEGGETDRGAVQSTSFTAAVVLRCYDENMEPCGNSYRDMIVVFEKFAHLPLCTLLREKYWPPEARSRDARILEPISAHFEFNPQVNMMDLMGAKVFPGEKVGAKLSVNDSVVAEPVAFDELLQHHHFYIVYLQLTKIITIGEHLTEEFSQLAVGTSQGRKSICRPRS